MLRDYSLIKWCNCTTPHSPKTATSNKTSNIATTEKISYAKKQGVRILMLWCINGIKCKLQIFYTSVQHRNSKPTVTT